MCVVYTCTVCLSVYVRVCVYGSQVHISKVCMIVLYVCVVTQIGVFIYSTVCVGA